MPDNPRYVNLAVETQTHDAELVEAIARAGALGYGEGYKDGYKAGVQDSHEVAARFTYRGSGEGDLRMARFLVDLAEQTDSSILLTTDPEEIVADKTVTIDPDMWRDMGYPSQITVTLQPGDALND